MNCYEGWCCVRNPGENGPENGPENGANWGQLTRKWCQLAGASQRTGGTDRPMASGAPGLSGCCGQDAGVRMFKKVQAWC